MKKHHSKEYDYTDHYCVQLGSEPTGHPLRSRVARASLETWERAAGILQFLLSVTQGLLHGLLAPGTSLFAQVHMAG